MSATDELRRLLDERGAEWWEGDDECKTLWESNGLTWEYFNDENGDAWLGFLVACEQDITPEQAIAATLGGSTFDADLERALSFMRIWISDDAHLGESDISYALERAEGLRNLDAIEQAITATMGRGTLTAEQVREAVMSVDRWEKPMDNTGLTNTHLIIRDDAWQAIADELNATITSRAERTCHNASYRVDESRFHCSECGYGCWVKDVADGRDKLPSYCPNCGARVVGGDA